MLRLAAFVVSVIALLGTAACSSDSPQPTSAPSAEVTDVSSGRALSEFEGSPTYPYRERLVETSDAYLAELGQIRDEWSDHRNVSDAISMCDDLARGLSEEPKSAQVERVQVRFEGGTTPDVTADEGRALLSAVTKYACPEFG
jgi:hypothetical protein